MKSAPQTTGSRCYQRDSEAAAPAGDGAGNGFYLAPRPVPWEARSTGVIDLFGRPHWLDIAAECAFCGTGGTLFLDETGSVISCTTCLVRTYRRPA